MEFEQIYNLVAGNMIAAVFALLWWDERKARKQANKRERANLRECAGLPDEDAANGEE